MFVTLPRAQPAAVLSGSQQIILEGSEYDIQGANVIAAPIPSPLKV